MAHARNEHSDNSSMTDLRKRAYDIACMHPEHPLAELLRHKALSTHASSDLELKILVERAETWLKEQRA